MTHYFINDPKVKHDRKQIVFRFLGVDYAFESDAGVFSKDHVDPGTARLLFHIVQDVTMKNFLDLGCGYGVVAIIVKTLFPMVSVTASDINQRAVDLTIQNASKHNVDITTIVSDGLTDIEQTFDCIGFNPPIKVGKSKMYDLFAQCHQHLTKHGRLWLVIRKDQGAKSAIRYLATLFASVDVIDKHKGYWILSCEKV